MKAILVVLTMLVGAGLFAEGSYMKLKAVAAQFLINVTWDSRESGAPPEVPWPWADTAAVARVAFLSNGVRQMVMRDASGESLAFGPGLVSDSSDPAADPIVIAGHRDTHFAHLREIAQGDLIRFETWQGVKKSFRVTGSRVIDTRVESLVLNQDRSSLTLVTCWPFDALIPGGPERLVVSAEPVVEAS